MDEVERLCDRVAVIHEGRIKALDTPDASRAAVQLEDTFVEMTGMSAILKTEAKLVLREPIGIGFSLVLPLVLLLVFGAPGRRPPPDPNLDGKVPIDTVMPSLALALSFGMLAVFMLPGFMSDYRSRGILRRLSTTPVHPAKLLGAQLPVQAAVAVASLPLVLALGAALGMDAAAGPARARRSRSRVGGAALFSLGSLVAALAPDPRLGWVGSAVIFFPSLFLAGVWLPKEQMPHWLARARRLHAARRLSHLGAGRLDRARPRPADPARRWPPPRSPSARSRLGSSVGSERPGGHLGGARRGGGARAPVRAAGVLDVRRHRARRPQGVAADAAAVGGRARLAAAAAPRSRRRCSPSGSSPSTPCSSPAARSTASTSSPATWCWATSRAGGRRRRSWPPRSSPASRSPAAHRSPSPGLFAALAVVNVLVAGTMFAFSLVGEERARQRQEMEREAGILQERQRLAREIHDTLAQGLTGIVAQLEAAAQARKSGADDTGYLDAAAQLARDNLKEARRSVRAIGPGELEGARLPGRARAGHRQLDGAHERARPLHHHRRRALAAPRGRGGAAARGAGGADQRRQARRCHPRRAHALLHGGPRDARRARRRRRLRADRRGFGLTGMRQRVHGVGGALAVESTPGEGTAISASVPAVPA